jgi:tetratricopeptide (TPR) repeat protein
MRSLFLSPTPFPALAIAAFAAFLPPAFAASPSRPELEAEHYQRCMSLARKDPAKGWEEGLAWHDVGGGHPAEHCAAVALIGLKQYGEAGARLEKLAGEMAKAPTHLQAQVLDQAGQAWLLAGETDRAKAVLERAIAILPDDPDLRIDHAEALAAGSGYNQAVTELDKALTLDPRRADALLYRASARRQLGQLDLAAKDIEASLKLAPDAPDALLESGNIRRLAGDPAGARKAWMQVLALAPDSPAGEAARDNIEKLALPQETAPPR